MNYFEILITFLFSLTIISCGYQKNIDPHLNENQNIPENISNIATPVNLGDPFYKTVQFIYKGDNKIQFEIDQDAIDNQKVAIISGKITDIDKNPLKDVKISILKGEKFGYTLTNLKGIFNIAVNGGGIYTLKYEKNGYIPIQRKIDTSKNNYFTIEDAILIQYSEKVTNIDLKHDRIQIASGELIDKNGKIRSGKLLFKPNTKAKLILNDQSSVDVDKLDIRITEFTTGVDGLKKMPAKLPISSGYTYAIELSADQAIEQNAQKVQFDKEIYLYVDNFLNFPVGSVVPVGYYDRKKGRWIASNNGIVIKFLSIDQNMVVKLDIDGDNQPDSWEKLDEIGLDVDELEKIAQQYKENSVFWRVPITHFTPYDLNWPYSCVDCTSPNIPKGGCDQSCQQTGSIIDVHKQTLGEIIPIFDGEYNLYYNSSYAKGYKSLNLINIDGSFDQNRSKNGSDSFIKGKLEVDIMGNHTIIESEDINDLKFSYFWDGKDRYGREITGQFIPAKVKLSYIYNATYMEPADREESFGKISDSEIEADKDRGTITLSKTEFYHLGNVNFLDQKMGGWIFDIFHKLTDDKKHIVGYLSNGVGIKKLKSDPQYITITKMGDIDNDSSYGFIGSISYNIDKYLFLDNNRVKSYNFRTKRATDIVSLYQYNIKNVEIYQDDLYFSTKDKIYKVETDTGDITEFKNFSNIYINGTNKEIDISVFKIFGNKIYVADSDYAALFKIDRDQQNLIHIAGDLKKSSILDDNFELLDRDPLKVKFYKIKKIVISDDEKIYLLDNDRKIFKIDNGVIEKIVGKNLRDRSVEDIDNQEFAKEINFNIDDFVYFEPLNGVVFISNGVFYKISDSMVTKLGTLNSEYGVDDKRRLLKSVKIYPSNRVNLVSKGGKIFLTDKVSTKKVGILKLDIYEKYIIPSDDGNLIYLFDQDGKHIETKDRLSGDIIYKFIYNEDNYLISILDRYGRYLNIERDFDNYANSIVNFNGDIVYLDIDKNSGLLKKVDHNEGIYHFMEYRDDQLLKSFKKPNRGVSEFQYGDMGELIVDQNPESGYKKIEKIDKVDEGKVDIIVETALGKVDKYETLNINKNSSKWVNYGKNGEKIITNFKNKGKNIEIKKGDGTEIFINKKSSEIFGEQNYEIESLKMELPDGKSYQIDIDREIEYVENGGAFDIKKIITNFDYNGEIVKKIYNLMDRELKTITPEGVEIVKKYDRDSKLVNYIQGDLYPIEYSYDQYGNLIKRSQGEGDNLRVVEYGYSDDGDLEFVKTATDQKFYYIYDQDGGVLENNGDIDSFYVDYNIEGDPEKIYIDRDKFYTFEYNLMDKLLKREAPNVDNGVGDIHYQYDLDQNMVKIDNGGDVIELFYKDRSSNLDYIQFNSGFEGLKDKVEYNYGESDGKILSIKRDRNILTYRYNGILKTEERSIGDLNYSLMLEYDRDLNIKDIVLNEDSLDLNIDYNKDGDIVKYGKIDYHYNSSGLLEKSLVYPFYPEKSVKTNYKYNGFGEIEEIKYTQNGDNVLELSYFYNKNGKVKKIIEKKDNNEIVERDYYYNKDQYLISVFENGVEVESYLYDKAGNRIFDKDNMEGIYDLQDRLISYGDKSFIYKDSGVLKQKIDIDGVTEYFYDGMGGLKMVKLPSGEIVEYILDGKGRRVGKKIDGEIVYYLIYKDQVNPIAMLNGDGEIIEKYIYGVKNSTPEYLIKGDKSYKVITDRVGTPLLYIDIFDKNIVKKIKYNSFGDIISDSNPEFKTIFGFAGGIYDQNTELIQFGVRDYDPKIGRWLSKEPLGFKGGRNFYTYCKNDPINYVDRTGLNPVGFVIGAVGGGILYDFVKIGAGKLFSKAKSFFSDNSYSCPYSPMSPEEERERNRRHDKKVREYFSSGRDFNSTKEVDGTDMDYCNISGLTCGSKGANRGTQKGPKSGGKEGTLGGYTLGNVYL